MTPIRIIATWQNIGGELTVRDGITAALGDALDDYDADAIELDYREAIAARLPAGAVLHGDMFVGPATDPPTWAELTTAVEHVDDRFRTLSADHRRRTT